MAKNEIPGAIFLILGLFVGIASYFMFKGDLKKSIIFMIVAILFVIFGIFKMFFKQEKMEKVTLQQKPFGRYCTKCGNQLREFDRFCYRCGHQLFHKR